jgi:hypothetical protein
MLHNCHDQRLLSIGKGILEEQNCLADASENEAQKRTDEYRAGMLRRAAYCRGQARMKHDSSPSATDAAEQHPES